MKYIPFSKPITNRFLVESCTTDTDDDDIATVTEFQHFVCVLTVDTARRSITKGTCTVCSNASFHRKVV